MKEILAEAAAVGQATVRALAYRCRLKDAFFYPDSAWNTPFVGGSSEFLHQGARLLDARSYFFFYATGITPAMAIQRVGAGSAYARGVRGREESADGRQQAAPAAQHPGQAVLVAGALRHRRARCCRRTSSFRASAARKKARRSTPTRLSISTSGRRRRRARKATGADLARQGVDRHSSPLRSAAAVLRQDWRPSEIEEVP
jgi:hypothetical protein